MAGARTVFVSGIFNVVHPGHMRLLRFAKELGDTLVVGVLSDELAGSAASVRFDDRLDGVSSLRFVDSTLVVARPVSEVIAELKPDIVVKGREHAQQWNEEEQAVQAYGGRLLFGSGTSFLDSDDLISREVKGLDYQHISAPRTFMNRHDISAQRLMDILDQFSQRKVVVVGDVIVDEFVSCHALGMSQEDPTVVVTPVDSERFLGGAGIVAAHAVGLGGRAVLHTVVGEDEAAGYLVEALGEYGVTSHLLVDESRPTTRKQRFRAGGKTLLRVSYLQQDPIAASLQEQMSIAIEQQLADADLLIFSDFNYGCLPQGVVDRVIASAREAGTLIVADSQSSSQVGNVARFKGADLITPTEREARLATRNGDDGLVVLADQLRELADSQLVFLTLGSDGVLVRGQDHDNVPATTDQIEALNRRPVDVSGAGDSLLVTSALALTCGATSMEAAVLGSIAAAIQVARIGNTPLLLTELQGVLQR
ncbi:MAG: PfkB family carbohydrate kinase [Actinomycetota bacterium]|nr:PfkB family carbohydrate kinase [Actinomycetota bacterium]